MRKDLLSELVKLYDDSDEYKRRVDALNRVYEHEDWKFIQDCLTYMRGIILTDMLSSRHTFQPAGEKDATQKAYFHIAQVLDFLSNPLNFIGRRKKRWETIIPRKRPNKGATRKEQ